MADARAIGKDSHNKMQGFNFRGIDAVMNHLHPIFAKHGVIVLPTIIQDKTEERETKTGGNLIYRILHIRFTFMADDGSSVDCMVIGEGMDTGDKASNKAMAIGLKYALTQMLLLPYDEVDPDAESHEVKPKSEPVKAAPEKAEPPKEPAKEKDDLPRDPSLITVKQARRLFAIATNAGVTEDTLKEHLKSIYKIEHSAEIRKAWYEAICTWTQNGGQNIEDEPDSDAARKDGNPF
jgi:hypothetical protein